MSHADLVWARAGRSLIGSGEQLRFDPGTGPDRYQTALTELRASGHEIALASFTFDPDEPGSIMLVPSQLTVSRSRPPGPPNAGFPSGHIASDGAGAWRSGMMTALSSIQAGLVDKVVLARQVDAVFDSLIPVRELVDRLQEGQPGSYVFLVDGLVGASPELLVSLENGVVTSLVLAGTASQSGNLESDKLEREHALAASSVEDGLARHVTNLEVHDRTVIEFGEVKHLATRLVGNSVPETTVLDVLASLHPTASVAGAPTGAALSLIRDLESSSRGRYAGPVGWFNAHGEGEFAIALRCALVRADRATLYSGGGIVAGSDTDSEYEETELKLRPMLTALGLD